MAPALHKLVSELAHAPLATAPELRPNLLVVDDRKENLLRRMTQLGTALFDYALTQSTVLTAHPRTGRPRFQADVLERVVRQAPAEMALKGMSPRLCEFISFTSDFA